MCGVCVFGCRGVLSFLFSSMNSCWCHVAVFKQAGRGLLGGRLGMGSRLFKDSGVSASGLGQKKRLRPSGFAACCVFGCNTNANASAI